ncbi:fibronectin type III domain-containing protein [Desulfoferrobacter suflitae]|uniref:fibronectin type III domain-containing protein n=1 Tax=Desulfoferrobacter suflitae TaxID=2865782 RepID=UPI0021644232|nr:PKD domain-containing protein [Desulfoferrobacter suflitae]MCK8603055.1 PKD domain-containing protein [Desulfoferrobacter suflitae]
MLWDNSVKNHVKVQPQSLNLFLVFALALLTFGVTLTGYAHAGRVTLAWDANDDANVAGYKLYYGNSSQQYQFSVDVGNVTTYSIENLPDGEKFYFAATAYDYSSHESDFSQEVSCVVNNQAPLADAGPDQTLRSGSEVTLSAANSSDPDGGVLSYEWTQTGGSSVVLSDYYAAEVVFIAPDVGPAGESLTFSVQVTDEWGAKSQAGCTVTVVSANLPPVADAGSQQDVQELEIVRLNGMASKDPDDGIDSYRWSQVSGPAVTLWDTDLPEAGFVAPDVGPEGASLEFKLTVKDVSGLESSDTCLVNVVWVNAAPVADVGSDQQVYAGNTAVLDGSGSTDPDDGIASYQWRQTNGPPVVLTGQNSARASFEAPAFNPVLTTLSFELLVTDHGGLKSARSCNVYVRKHLGNLKKIK